MIFYFNHTTGLSKEKPVECFESLMLNYRKLTKRSGLHIERGIITKLSPREIQMGHLTLSALMEQTHDKDLKRWVYSQFDKYPADIYYSIDQLYKEYAECDYTYYIDSRDGFPISATHLLAPLRLGWPLLSMPVSETWRANKIALKCSSDSCAPQWLTSFHGENDENFNYVAQDLIKINYQDETYEKAETKIACLKNCVGRHDLYISPEFESRFHELALDEQQNTVSLVQKAFDSHKLFPIKADKQLIKRCQGKGNEATYELRDRGKGIRIYFQGSNDALFLGGVHTKAEGEGREQSADINRATSACKKLIKEILIS